MFELSLFNLDVDVYPAFSMFANCMYTPTLLNQHCFACTYLMKRNGIQIHTQHRPLNASIYEWAYPNEMKKNSSHNSMEIWITSKRHAWHFQLENTLWHLVLNIMKKQRIWISSPNNTWTIHSDISSLLSILMQSMHRAYDVFHHFSFVLPIKLIIGKKAELYLRLSRILFLALTIKWSHNFLHPEKRNYFNWSKIYRNINTMGHYVIVFNFSHSVVVHTAY